MFPSPLNELFSVCGRPSTVVHHNSILRHIRYADKLGNVASIDKLLYDLGNNTKLYEEVGKMDNFKLDKPIPYYLQFYSQLKNDI